MNNTIHQTSQYQCTGCSACACACPTGAITMVNNTQGFYAPVVDEDLCIQCGKCLKACPVNKKSPHQRISSFYGWHKDTKILYNSTSGGAFRALADQVMAGNGVVYGAIYNGDFTEVLFGDSDSVDLQKFQKSKYIVSNPQKAYQRIKQQLENGRFVLFSGAPCQVAGLVSFLEKKYDNLLTVDFVCGGMPSLRFWQEHVKMLEKKFKSKISSVDFRSKRKGWGRGYLEINFVNGKRYFSRDYLDSYYHCFCDEHISVRSSCLGCQFHNDHFSDITIADFWGYSRAGVADVQNGVSLIVTNSDYGTSFVQGMHNFCIQSLDNRYSDYAIAKETPTQKARLRQNVFFDLAQQIGFEKASKQMCPATMAQHIKAYVKIKLHWKE